MSKHLRTFSLLALFFSLFAASAVRAQSGRCAIILSELNQPVACAGGTYTVRFDVTCPLTTTCWRVQVAKPIPVSPFYIFQTPYLVVDTTICGAAPLVINLPTNLDTNIIYGIRVVQQLDAAPGGRLGISSNIKTFSVREVDRSPKPSAVISILRPIKDVYCPKDTIIFQIDELNVTNNIPPATYQWLLNGTPIIGADRQTLRYSGWRRGDCISLLVTKGNPCAFNDTGSSNKICPNIKQPAEINIRLLSGSGCADSNSTYRADTMNIGRGGRIQWFLNNIAVAGANGLTYQLQAGQATCRTPIFARAYIADCPDTIKSNTLNVNSCGKVRVDGVVPPSFCAGRDITITYSTLACFNADNAFIFELSDASGSFANPTVIGSIADTNGGTTTLTTPTTLVAGTGYRLRIRSTSPEGISINTFGPLTIFALPTPPQAVPAVRCGPGRVTLRVTSPTTTSYQWYTSATGDDLVERPGGAAVTTDTFTLFVSRDTTFYVAAVSAQGCSSALRTPVSVRVGSPLTVSAGPDQPACQAGPCIDLLGATPVGGVFSGPGINGTQFCPGNLAAGVYTILYKYVSPEGCRDSATKQITIDSIAAPDAGTPDSSVCKPGPPLTFQLKGFSPLGGAWEGSPAVTASGVVTPALLSVPGPDTLRYRVTVGVCSRTDFRVLRAIPTPTFTISVTRPVACRSKTATATLNPFDANWQITLVNAQGQPAGVRTGSRIDSLAAGTYTITVTANPGGCSTVQSFVVEDPAGATIGIMGLAPSYCSQDPCAIITATPPGGTFSSSPANAIDGLTGLFCPSSVQAGPVFIFYAFTDPITGCVGADTVQTRVNQSPGIAPEADTTVCGNADPFLLSAGGVWTGSPAITQVGTRYQFNPALASGVVNIITKSVIANGCTSTVNKTIFINPVPQITISPSGSTRICRGDSVTLNASVIPPGGFAFVWLRNGTNIANTRTPSLVVYKAGVYTLQVIDTIGLTCSFTSTTSSATVIVDSVTGLSAGADTSLCRNAGAYALTGTPAGGTFAGPGVTGNQFDPSAVAGVGTYTIVYRSRTGVCADSATVRITVRDAIAAGLAADRAAVCGTSATLRASPTGSYTYFYYRNDTLLTPGGSAAPVFAATRSGSYKVFVAPLTGSVCADTSPAVQILISQPPTLPVLTNLSLCEGDAAVSLPSSQEANVTTVWTGTAGVSPLGPNNFAFDPGQSGPGSFTLQIKLTSGACADSATITADVGRRPSFVVQTENATSCGSSDGRATITPVAPGVRYTLNPECINCQQGASFVNLSPGPYTITAIDSSSGCVTIVPFTINSPDNFRANIAALPRTSFCRNDSAVALRALPDSGQFTVVPVGPGTTTVINGVFNPSQFVAGDYLIVYAVDSGICTGRDTVAVSVRAVPAARITPQGPINLCGGRSVALVADSTPGATYQFANQNGPIAGATSTSYTANATGFYTVAVTVGGCSSTSQQVTVTVQPSPGAGISVVPDTSGNGCENRPETLIATGNGTSFNWSLGGTTISSSQQITVTTPGDYRLIVSNATCSDTAFKEISFAPRVELSIISDPALLQPCVGGTASLQASAPNAVLTVTDNNGAQVGPSGSGFLNFTTSTAGVYTLTARGGACDTSIQFTVAPTPKPDTSIVVTGSTRFCTGSSAVLTVGSANAFPQWHGPAGFSSTDRSITVSVAGGYTLIVSTQANGLGCVDSGHVTIVVDSVPQARIAQASPISVCQNAPLTLNANGGDQLTYQWYSGPTLITGATGQTLNVNTSQAGDQTILVEVRTAAGCTARSVPVAVQVKTTPQASLTAIGGTNICQGQNVTLAGNTFSTATSYFLRDRTDSLASPTPPTPPVIQVTQRGSYTFVLDLNGCKDTSDPVAVRIPQIGVVIARPDTQVCVSAPAFPLYLDSATSGGTLAFTGPGVVPGTFTFNPALAGIGQKVIFLVKTDSGCSIRDSQTITVIQGFTSSVSPASTLVCAQSRTTLTAIIDQPTQGANYTFQWFRNDTIIAGAIDSMYTATQVGTYTVVATAAECSSLSTPGQITFFPFQAVDAGRNVSVCQGAAAFQLTGASPAGGRYVDSARAVDPLGNFTPGGNGIDTIYYVTNQNGCRIIDSLYVFVNAHPTVKATYASSVTGDRDPLDILDAATLSAAVTGNVVSYAWTSPAGALSNQASPVVAPTTSTLYRITVTSDSGCTATDTVTVIVRNDVRVANGFSPNGDGKNDFWNIYNIQAYPDADIRVYNRWGALVYKATGADYAPAKGFAAYWKGDDGSGNQVPTSVYYYTIDLKNNTKPFVGSITVAR